jgi:hypothetical protein
MDNVINVGKQVPMLSGDGIQSSVVKLPIFLLDEEDQSS